MKQIVFLFSILSLISFKPFGQALPIGIDGNFDDWAEATSNYVDTEGDGGDYDLLSFTVSNDSSYLYLRLVLSGEILLNDYNLLTLEIDGDNNPSTGYAINGIGAELGFIFGERNGIFYTGSGSQTVYHNDIKFAALPTVTSDTFEIAVGRDVMPDGVHPLFTSATIKICFVDSETGGDLMPNQGTTFSYTFDDTAVESYVSIPLEKSNADDIRLMTYNTLSDGLLDGSRVNSFRRIISAVDPDIITFNECWNTEWWDVNNLLNTWLPITPDSWQCIKIDAGNITCSRYEISNSYAIYADDAYGFDDRITASIINLPDTYPRDFLVINAHFKASGGSEANQIRQEEADAIIEFIRDAKTPGGSLTLPVNTPIVISGDLNLVGESQQLTTLLTGDIVNTGKYGPDTPPDWDNSDFKDVYSYQTDQRTAYTWVDNFSSFWPGRLDYTISSEVGFTVSKTYILNTGTMPQAKLTEYGLQANDSYTASDHYTKVTDFVMDESIGVNDAFANTGHYMVYPNPSNGLFEIKSDCLSRLEVFDISGKLITTQILSGVTNMTIDFPGIYFIRFTNSEGSVVRRVVVE